MAAAKTPEVEVEFTEAHEYGGRMRAVGDKVITTKAKRLVDDLKVAKKVSSAPVRPGDMEKK